MTTDLTSTPLVHTLPGAADILVECHHYTTEQGPLEFDLYRPREADASCPAVVLVSGRADPGVTAFFGRPTKDWASTTGWARLIAASGLAAITYVNRDPADVGALVLHLRDHAATLGLDPARLGLWAASGNVPTALAVLAHAPIACAALLYGYLLDLDGATAVADGARQFYFAAPPVGIDELPATTPLLVVRAGRDTTPGLDATLQRFVAAARARQLPVTLLDHAEAPHAFDLLDDTPRTHAVIDEVLGFLARHLRAAPR